MAASHANPIFSMNIKNCLLLVIAAASAVSCCCQDLNVAKLPPNKNFGELNPTNTAPVTYTHPVKAVKGAKK